MTNVILNRYRWAVVLFVVAQAVIALLPVSIVDVQVAVAMSYLFVAGFAVTARAPWATAVCVAATVVRLCVALDLGGTPLRASLMVFSDLFVVLVILEVEYRRMVLGLRELSSHPTRP